jgi:hypothetical protein
MPDVAIFLLSCVLTGVMLIAAQTVIQLRSKGPPAARHTLTYHWVDAGRPEVFTADPNDHRELIVRVWYPAQPSPSAPRAPYVQDAGALAPGLARLARETAKRCGSARARAGAVGARDRQAASPSLSRT